MGFLGIGSATGRLFSRLAWANMATSGLPLPDPRTVPATDATPHHQPPLALGRFFGAPSYESRPEYGATHVVALLQSTNARSILFPDGVQPEVSCNYPHSTSMVSQALEGSVYVRSKYL